jgi:hypothetical protein
LGDEGDDDAAAADDDELSGDERQRRLLKVAAQNSLELTHAPLICWPWRW